MPLSAEQCRFLNRLGRAIKTERERAELTQQEFAEMADLDVRTIQKIEAGKLNILVTTLSRLRHALKCGWEDLLN